MKRLLFPALFLIFISYCKAQQAHSIVDNDRIIEFTTQNGMLNGKYISYYPNGIKKAEGIYTNNQRKGIWTVWDSAGNKRIKRVFQNALDARIVAAWDAKGNKIDTVKNYSDKRYINYDSVLGYKPWNRITEHEVGYSHRLWRFIPTDSGVNKLLFEDGRLYKALYKGVKEDSVICYGDEEFQSKIAAEKMLPYEKVNITGIRIKEDVFYNLTMNLGETRIIALAFVGMIDGKPADFGWFYFPGIRDLLAKQPLPDPITPDLQNLENIFTERFFSSSVYKESNIWGRQISDYKSGPEVLIESQCIEMRTLDAEFEYWFKKL